MNIYGRDAEQGGASCLQHFNSLQKRFVFNYDSNLWHMRVCVCECACLCVLFGYQQVFICGAI